MALFNFTQALEEKIKQKNRQTQTMSRQHTQFAMLMAKLFPWNVRESTSQFKHAHSLRSSSFTFSV